MKRFFFLCLLLFVCGRAFAGPLVSLSVKKAPTEEVFRSLASMSGKNIVFPEVTGELPSPFMTCLTKKPSVLLPLPKGFSLKQSGTSPS